MTLGQQVIDRKRTKQPIPQRPLFKVLRILEEVLLGGFVALNVDVEHGLNGLSVVVKGAQ